MEYLGIKWVRVFVGPLYSSVSPAENVFDWRSWAGNLYSATRQNKYGNQFGLDFDGNQVINADSFANAITNLRAQSTPRKVDFFNWLESHQAINWTAILTTLNTTTSDIRKRQGGNAAWALFNLGARDYDVMALWDIRCNALPFQSFDASEPMYWAERWEEWRLFYIGGRWMSKYRVKMLELYNEPDHDTYCMTPERWADSSRIRADALRAGYVDTAANGYDLIPLKLYGPASAGSYPTKLAPVSVLLDQMHKHFPSNDTDDSYNLIDGYTFHRYGSFPKDYSCTDISSTCKPSNGYELRQTYDTVVKKLNSAGFGYLPVGVTEFNSYMYATSDSDLPFFLGKHVFDHPSTGAALASQVAGFATESNAPSFISVHKMVQNLGTANSQQGKTGLFYGDIYNLPHAINGPTLTGESYRMMVRYTSQMPTMEFKSTIKGMSVNRGARVSVFGVDIDKTYHVFIINQDVTKHTVRVDLTAVNADPNSWFVASGTGFNPTYTGSYLYGDVVARKSLAGSPSFKLDLPPGNVYRVAVSKVPTNIVKVEPLADTTLLSTPFTKSNALGTTDTLIVSSTLNPSVALIRFHSLGQTGSIGIQNAVLSLHLDAATNNQPQLVAVLAVDGEWDENSVVWNQFDILKPNAVQVQTTTDNYINWWASPAPKVVGYIVIPPGASIPPGGTRLELDVTDSLNNNVESFMLVRLKRYDQSAGQPPYQLDGEALEGWYTFGSREATDSNRRPNLVIQYQV